MAELSVSEVARLVGGEVIGEGDPLVRGVAPLDAAGPEHLSFVANARYLPYVQGTSAAAILLPREMECTLPEGAVAVRVGDPHAALAALLPVLYPQTLPPPGIHPTAVVGEGTKLGEGVTVGPYAVIGRGVHFGDRCRIGAHAVVGDGCVVGAGTVLHPHATLYPGVTTGERCIVHSGARVGSDGFGYVLVDGRRRGIPQVGGVRLGDEVEVGANTTIDRGSVGDTVVGDGTKLDNLVQVGHNCRIGRQVIVISQVGIAGSTTVGDYTVIAGQAGVQGHVRVGSRVRIGGQSGVTGDVPDGATVSGYPARPHREAMRAQAALFRLPGLMEKVRRLERAVFGRKNEESTSD